MGRPAGRPNKATEGGKTLAIRLNELLKEKGRKNGLLDIAMEILEEKGSPQRAQILKMCWEWQYGKAPQPVTGEDGGPVQIAIVDTAGMRG